MPSLRRPSSDATPLDGVDVVLADLDGVVYKGHQAIEYAVESLEKAALNARVGYITNNASRTDQSVATQLVGLGLGATANDVVTSSQAAVRLLATEVAPKSLILVIGGEGLRVEVERAGFRITDSADDLPDAVIQGFSPDLAWVHLAEAAFALARGIPWVATNMDWTIPVARGVAPGNGTLVSAVHSPVGRLPIVGGKPERAIFDEARRRFDATSPLFIGDRLDTDIMGANRAEMPSLLVLTGIDRAKQLLAADAKSRPDYIIEDLRQLHEPYPATVFTRDDSQARVGRAKVRIEGNDVRIIAAGDSSLDLLRAACAVIWKSGRAIYGLQVPESLYS